MSRLESCIHYKQEEEEMTLSNQQMLEILMALTPKAILICSFGNVGRLIRHSCSPNFYAKRVRISMMFAAENIAPGTELTFNYKLW